MDDMLKSFSENTIVKMDGDRCRIDCKRGFWAVDCPSFEMAATNALYYFQQYYGDGEYYKKESGA